MTMSFFFTNVKRHRSGATWTDGSTRTCTRCQADPDIIRTRQAIITAVLRRKTTRFKVPVAYCERHVPEELS